MIGAVAPGTLPRVHEPRVAGTEASSARSPPIVIAGGVGKERRRPSPWRAATPESDRHVSPSPIEAGRFSPGAKPAIRKTLDKLPRRFRRRRVGACPLDVDSSNRPEFAPPPSNPCIITLAPVLLVSIGYLHCRRPTLEASPALPTAELPLRDWWCGSASPGPSAISGKPTGCACTRRPAGGLTPTRTRPRRRSRSSSISPASSEDDFEIQLFEDALVVEGRRRLPSCEDAAVYHVGGDPPGPVPTSSCRCRPRSTPERVEARYDRGLLRITLPKRAEAR